MSETIVNVKNVDVTTWERAKEVSKDLRITLGELVTRALRQHFRAIDNPAEAPIAEAPAFPKEAPGSPVVWDNLSATMALNAQMQAVAALATAAGVKLPASTVKHAAGLLDDSLRAARGLPPKSPGEGASGSRGRDERGRFAALPATTEAPPAVVEGAS